MFFGSNTTQSQPTNTNQINQNTGYINIANTGYIDPYVSYQQTTPGINNTPLVVFDSNEDFGNQLFNQYGVSYLECSMPYNASDGSSETPSDQFGNMYRSTYDRDAPDDHVHSNTFEDTTIINVAYHKELSNDENRWEFYKNHKREINNIQNEIRQLSGSNDQSSNRSGTTGFGQSNTSFFGQSATTGFGQTSNTIFGQPTSNTGFGQTNTTIFGQPTSNTTFGQTSSSPFGQSTTSSGFGQPSTIGFGQPATVGFGQTNNTNLGQTTVTGFGQSGINNTGFGQSNVNTTVFGQTGINSGFGQTTNTVFGQPTSNSGFGQLGINTGFGQSNAANTGFGQSTTSTGFGQSSNSPFGQTITNTAFGQNNINTSGFGQPTATTGFGQTINSPFGQPSTNTTLVQSNTSNTGFGQTATNTAFGQTSSSPFAQSTTSSGFGQPSNIGFGQPATVGFGQSIIGNTAFSQPNVNTSVFGQTGINTGFGQPNNSLLSQPAINTGLGQPNNIGFSQPAINTGFGQTNINTGFGLPTTSNNSFGQTDVTNTSFGQPSINTGFGQCGINTGFTQPGLNNTFVQPNNTAFGQPNIGTAYAQPTFVHAGFGQTNLIDSGFLNPSIINNPGLHRSMPDGTSVYVQPVNVYDGTFSQSKIKRYKSGRVSFLGSLSEIESIDRPNDQFGTNGTSNKVGSSMAGNDTFRSLNGSGAFNDYVNKPGNSTVNSLSQNADDLKSPLNTKTLAEEVRAELLIFDRHMMEGKFDREREFNRIMRSFDADRYYVDRPISSKSERFLDFDENSEDDFSENEIKSEPKKHPNLYLLKPPYGPTPKDFIIETFKRRAEQEKAEEEVEEEVLDFKEDGHLLVFERACKEGYGVGERPKYNDGGAWEHRKKIEMEILEEIENKRREKRKEREKAYSKTYEEVLEKAYNMMNSDENFLEPDSTWNWDDPLSNLQPKKRIDEYESEDEEDKQVIEKPGPFVNPNAPKLRKEGYTTRPSISVLKAMTDKELSEVKEFQIWRDGYGDILFPGLTDLRGLDLDDVVDIGYRRVSLYAGKTKAPSEGTGLNKRAYVSMNNCTPDTDERTRFTNEMSHKYMMRKYTQMIGCNYLAMNFNTGTWMFETPFFVGTADGIVRDGTIKYFDAEKSRDLLD